MSTKPNAEREAVRKRPARSSTYLRARSRAGAAVGVAHVEHGRGDGADRSAERVGMGGGGLVEFP